MELKVVALGGGTGLSTLLRGLKHVTDDITAIVAVSDDGGSSGRLRVEMGVLPPGDIRNCLVALADSESLMAELFSYRFTGTGSLAGHSFGNLFIAAMSEITGDFELAVKRSSEVLAIRGRVLPATCDDCSLGAILADGRRVMGESVLASYDSPIERVFLSPADCHPLPEALDAIEQADAIVLGPGSLYTSVMPTLLVPGMPEAIKRSRAVKVYACNVMTESGETTGYTAQRHLEALRAHAGPDIVEWIIVSTSTISDELRRRYLEEGAEPVEYDADALRAMGVGVMEVDVSSQTEIVRHDPMRLALAVAEVALKSPRRR
jgi:uncharacterized cofD-like protein